MSDRLPRAGLASAAAAFLMWGLFPLYWKQLKEVPALEIVAHRTAWGLLSVAAWVTVQGRWPAARAVAARPRTVLVLATSAILIALNWLLYIWAVIHGHVVQASLGYYVNPLVNVLLGVVVLREGLTRAQKIAVALAAAGVAVLTLGYGQFPWIALALACTFGLYGLVRKTVDADAVTGLLWETALLAPAAVTLLLVLQARGTGSFGTRPLATALLVLGGAVTALPLALFAHGARALPLSTLGFVQYLSPTIQFLLALAVYHEPFTRAHAVTFLCIWTALALLWWDLRRRLGPAVTAETGYRTATESVEEHSV
ncbi:MAG TPA: EamA family transporter RarD [Vicinamibacteria bacterium]|nr:EamA family transporter RarD [Vicinamibacteria bacterium]